MAEVMEQPAQADSAPANAGTPQSDDPKAASLFSAGDPAGDDQSDVDEAAKATSDDDSEEIDHEGEKFRVPKKLKDAFLRQQDYTRKTQEVAEARKEVAEARRAFEQQVTQSRQLAALQQANFADMAKVYSISERIAQFAQLDWDALTNADPVQAQKLDRQMRTLQAQKYELEQGIAQKQHHLTFEEQRASATQIEDGRRELQRDIKGWSPELQQKLMDTAQGYGFRPEELAQVSDPRTVKLLHDAYQYRELMSRRAAAKPATDQAPKPVTRVSGAAASNTKPLSETSFDEYVRARREYIRKNR